MADQKKLVRRYFECWSATRRGGKIPYTRIEWDMRDNKVLWIDPARLPPGITVLSDMKGWTRAVLDSWILHLLWGQRKELPAEAVFAFAQVPRPGDLTPVPTRELVDGPVDGVKCD
ncbi:hypothetical protein FRC09_002438 [Ceratobasidium sp. 395]|nr:hypothetical protein FRC09_002438 [Ceratobasidium sp. 395]